MIHRKGGMIIPGPYSRRGRVRKSPKGSAPTSSGVGTWNNKYITSGGKNNLDEIAYAMNSCTTRSNQFTGATKQPGKSGYGLAERTNFADDVKSNVSQLGMGGVSCGVQSVAETTADTETTTSTRGLFQSLAQVARKAQHRAGMYLFPISPAVTRRKKFDRSDSLDSLEDILLEEGAKPLPHRYQHGIRRSRHVDDEDDDDIDYFSRAMSASNNNGMGGSRRSKQKSLSGRNKAAIMGGLSIILTVAFTIYRMPAKLNKRSTFRQHHNEQILEYYPDAIDDDIERQASVNRFGQIKNNVNVVAAGVGYQDSTNQQQKFLVDDIRLPRKFDALADIDGNLSPGGTYVPFYWHIPRSSGGTMNDVLGG